MLGFIISLVVLLLALFLGIVMHKDPGVVVVNWHHWQIESSAWTAVLSLLLLFVVLYYFLKLLGATQRFPERMQFWNATRRLKQSQKQTNIGLCALAEGDWARAEKALIKGIVQGGNPLVNYFGAARAAQEQGAIDRSQMYLKQAHESTSHSEVAIAMTQAKLQLNSGRLEQAIATLQLLHEKHPKHAGVIKQLQYAYQQRGDWRSIQKLLPDIKRVAGMDHYAFHQLASTGYAARLKELFDAIDTQGIQDYWQSLPREFRHSNELLLQYVRYLNALSLDEPMRCVIEERLKKQYQADLLAYYTPTSGDDLRHQIKVVRGCLKQHPQDPDLLLCMARLHIAEHVWGRAKQYLEELIESQPSSEAYALLAEVYSSLDDSAQALHYYQQAFRMRSMATAVEA